MVLPSIQQNYLVMKALEERDSEGIADLVLRMERISGEAFDNTEYIFVPAALGDILCEVAEEGYIRILRDGAFALTGKGRMELKNTEHLVQSE